MVKIVADDRIPFLRGVLEPFAEVVYLPGDAIDPAAVRDADALLVRTRTRCDAALLAASRVKLAVTATIGCDHFNIPELDHLGIAHFNAPGCNAASVAQYLAAVLTAARRPLAGKTLGIVGAGEVGRRAAAVGKAFGMRVLLSDPPRARREGEAGFSDLKTIAREADFISFHTPLTRTGCDPTFHLANDAFFEECRRRPYLINAARGGVVDEAALQKAMNAGLLSGAALDTWENEPVPAPETLGIVQWATPHIAGYSADGKANGTTQTVRTVARFFHFSRLLEWRTPPPDVPGDGVICLSANESPEEQLYHAVHTAYPLARDDAALRRDPSAFEALRGDYPLRRELFAYRFDGGFPEVRRILRQLQEIR